MPFGLNRGYEMEGGQGLLLHSNFSRMISCMTFYRNMISLSVYHISSYTALSGPIGGHFLTNILLRTCIVIKVTLATFHIT